MSYNIAALDVETASLRMDAAILEIGLVIVDIGSKSDYSAIDLSRSTSFLWPVSLLEQLLINRSVDPGTLKFHLKQQGKASFDRETVFEVEDPNDIQSVHSALDQLKAVLKENDVKEIWMNHTTFDSGRLNSLAEYADYQSMPLWGHRMEKDVFTLRDEFNISIPGTASHRAVPDCNWLLLTLKKYGEVVKVLTSPREVPILTNIVITN